ncbi:MAG: long-chain-fatty-acid--CoA ligase [Alphaproteobacteria bacterium]
MLDDAVRKSPDAIAVSFEGRDLTYRDYAVSIGSLARELMDLGAAGERIALLMANSVDMAIAMFAVHAAGAQAVPLNPLYTAREAGYILNDSAPIATIHDAGLVDLVGTLENTGALIASEGAGFAVQAAGEAPFLPTPFPEPDSLATLQYTGGTTGYPKGVNITHRQMSVNISQREAILPTAPDEETIVCVMPLFHVFAVSMCLNLAAYCRGRLVILPRYTPQLLCETIATEGVSILPAGPTIYNGLLNFDRFDGSSFSHLKWCYSGSAPLPEETLRRWQNATGCFILEGYGQTEAGPVLTYNPAQGSQKPGSVGIPLEMTEIEIVDLETGEIPLPAGAVGEIRARGPQIMAGYRNLPEETAETLRNGWLHTGDIGEFDRDGYLFIRDRKKDMAIVGGYNVFPREIDEVLYAHPDVAEAAALGVPDDHYGEIIHAWVTLKPGAECTAEDLIAHCESNLACYKVPKVIMMGADIPKTTVGKIDKKALRQG